MHSYDPSRQPYQSQIPAMRPARDGSAGHSATPIYDALYSEYLRAFKALPGDRSGEEDLRFRAFGAMGLHSGRGGFSGDGDHTEHRNTSAQQGNWQPYYQVGRHSAQPAALPPAPRRGM
ncbi:hypothetical protein HW130_20580 [Streptomyces sp. PKU-EA00015]|nr:hypothetical protein [Streptomyces sp. PKU-EA00015]NWF28632.1 hypothetical protein [Streptomyces sp. PKU-EA00015]